jgi:hypothetical protein
MARLGAAKEGIGLRRERLDGLVAAQPSYASGFASKKGGQPI